MKFVKVFFIVVGLAFVGIQFLPSGRDTSPAERGTDFIAATQPPAPIAAMLRGACYDCHSQETRRPWYNNVAPVSWWLEKHINEGRDRLDFSDWPATEPKRAKKKLGQIADAVNEKTMPLPSYTWMHSAARFTAEQRKTLADWAEAKADEVAETIPAEPKAE